MNLGLNRNDYSYHSFTVEKVNHSENAIQLSLFNKTITIIPLAHSFYLILL